MHLPNLTSTHFSAMLYFYTPWKRQKTFGFLIFPEGIEIKHCDEMGYFLIPSSIENKLFIFHSFSDVFTSNTRFFAVIESESRSWVALHFLF